MSFLFSNYIPVKIYPHGPNGPGRDLLPNGPGRAGPKNVGPCAPLFYLHFDSRYLECRRSYKLQSCKRFPDETWKINQNHIANRDSQEPGCYFLSDGLTVLKSRPKTFPEGQDSMNYLEFLLKWASNFFLLKKMLYNFGTSSRIHIFLKIFSIYIIILSHCM